jgi:hypothetical protein
MTLFFTGLTSFGLGDFGLFHVRLIFSSPNAYLFIVGVFIAVFPKFAQNLMLFLLSDPSRNLIRPDAQLQIKRRKNQLGEILCTDFQDMLVLASTVSSRYYNCFTDGSTSFSIQYFRLATTKGYGVLKWGLLLSGDEPQEPIKVEEYLHY